MTKEAPEFAQDHCPFCGVVSHDSRDQIFFSSDDVVAFLDINPAARGHTLVVPRIHAATVFDMNEEQFSATMSGVWRVANLLKQRLNPEGLTLIQSNGAAAWQDVRDGQGRGARRLCDLPLSMQAETMSHAWNHLSGGRRFP